MRQYILYIIVTISFVIACVPSFANTQQMKSIQKKLIELETSSGGRLGIFAINTANNAVIQYRASERFPLQSTFKVIAVAAILKKSMADHHLLQQKIIYNKHDIVFWSPITTKSLLDGANNMTIFDLSAAAIKYSDNTATNLVIKQLGGLEVVTDFARSIGDSKFRLDHWEPELNSNPHDLQDTSTPQGMAKNLQQLTLGNNLGLPQRKQLIIWMKGITTGNHRIRAGVPKGWVVADKTGSGDYGITNDIGIIWPPKHAPILIAIYFMQSHKNAAHCDKVIASATRLLMQAFELRKA